MSFDLYAFDLPNLPADVVAIEDLLEDDRGGGSPLTDRLADLVAELEERFPNLDDDPNGVPWASWPLAQSMVGGRCCGFNIAWTAAERMLPEIASACKAHGVTLYDPQAGKVIPPGESTAHAPDRPRRWPWRRRG